MYNEIRNNLNGKRRSMLTNNDNSLATGAHKMSIFGNNNLHCCLWDLCSSFPHIWCK